MKPYIYTERNGIYIIDLKKTLRMLREAYKFARDQIGEGGKALFVGTKKQAAATITEEAQGCGMLYVNNRWLGGTLTNFKTVRNSIDRMIHLDSMFEDGSISKYSKKEQSSLNRELQALKKNLGGLREMKELPTIMFVIDPQKEEIACREARRLGIPVIGVVDTNCDPDRVDWVIPANDDAIRSIKLMASQMAEAVQEGLASREPDPSEADAPIEAPLQGFSAEELEQRYEVLGPGGAPAQPTPPPPIATTPTPESASATPPSSPSTSAPSAPNPANATPS